MSPPNNSREREWLTQPEVMLLIAKELKPYHDENREAIAALNLAIYQFKEATNAALNQLKGSIKTAAFIVSIILTIAGLLIALYKR